jgi:hypothetical protein
MTPVRRGLFNHYGTTAPTSGPHSSCLFGQGPHSLGRRTRLYMTQIRPTLGHPSIQIEEGDPVTLYSNPQNQSQDDYPDGGLRAWLVVLGVRLLA